MKKILITVFILITGYAYAQEVPAWVDTSKTGASRYQSVSNALPLPVNSLVPMYRTSDEMTYGATDTVIFNLNGKYNFVEVAWKDTGTARDTVFLYTGIIGTADTAWSRINVVDLSDWSTDEFITFSAAGTKQWWIRGTRITLLMLVLANTSTTYPGLKGKYYLEAK